MPVKDNVNNISAAVGLLLLLLLQQARISQQAGWTAT